ncbi:hypothetical protein [Streptomyces sp. DSM 40907]|uniref:hypothetical protein n=1 Tax=Streptomyces kutzneri TaxID=3051179 RepID=UPI0028D776F1|nr:hypothetical protein [Streptomyces sp. DSM 40907]
MHELARALGAGVAGSSRIHDAFANPRLPAWGLVQLLVVELATRAPGTDATAEVKRFRCLWDAAAQADTSATTENGTPSAQAVTPAGPEQLPSRQGAARPDAAAGPSRPLGSVPSLLLVDIEGFRERDDVERAYMHRMLYEIIDRVMAAARIRPSLRHCVGLGDAVMEMIDPSVAAPSLLRAVLTTVPDQLRPINRLASAPVQLRLRLVLATGFVTSKEFEGWMVEDLGQARSLLDSDVLRAALRECEDGLALCVSEAVYQEAVGSADIPAEAFHEIAVPTKDGPLRAWLHSLPPSAWASV